MAAKSYALDFNGYWRVPSIGGLPVGSGVYGVFACTHNTLADTVALQRLLYIGEAENVQARIAGHERWSDWARELKMGEELCFNAALISPATDRQRAEAAMIFHHKPPCNIEYVHNFSFDATSIATSAKNALMNGYFTVQPTSALGGLARASLIGGSGRW